MNVLLDTHILLWWLEDQKRLSREQLEILSSADADSPLQVADVSLWEIATLYGLGRVELTIPLREWLEDAVAPPLVRRRGISPAIAAALASLPDSFHRDPADRILVATARVYRATLLTNDHRIIKAKLVKTTSSLTPG